MTCERHTSQENNGAGTGVGDVEHSDESATDSMHVWGLPKAFLQSSLSLLVAVFSEASSEHPYCFNVASRQETKSGHGWPVSVEQSAAYFVAVSASVVSSALQLLSNELHWVWTFCLYLAASHLDDAWQRLTMRELRISSNGNGVLREERAIASSS